MSSRLSLLNRYTAKALLWFFPFFMINYYLIMRGINLNVILGLPFIGLFYVYGLTKVYMNPGKTIYSLWMYWFSYSILSICLYLINKTPISCYTSAFRSTLFPFMFTYLGYYFANQKINKNYLISCSFCFLIGFYLYFYGPSYYINFLREVRENTWYMKGLDYNKNTILEFTRFCSFFTTSYAISFLSIPALCFSLNYLVNEKKSPINKYLNYVVCFSSFVAAILCQQRVAIVAAICIVLYYSIVSYKRGNKKFLIVYMTFIMIIVVIITFLQTDSRFKSISELITDRFEKLSFSDAYSERAIQRDRFDRMTAWSMFTGLGMGSCGHAASMVGLRGINDGEIFKIFYEYGIIGSSIFWIIIISTIKQGIKYLKYLTPDLIVVSFYLVAALGASSLSMFFESVMFWFCVGRIWNKHYLEENIKYIDNQ